MYHQSNPTKSRRRPRPKITQVSEEYLKLIFAGTRRGPTVLSAWFINPMKSVMLYIYIAIYIAIYYIYSYKLYHVIALVKKKTYKPSK